MSEEKKFNPTVTAFFDSPKWVRKSFKDQNGNGPSRSAFLSAPIDAKALKVLVENVQLGSKLLITETDKLNKNGGPTFYMEVVPPSNYDKTSSGI